LFVNCSDVFAWACSDAETISSDEELKHLYEWCVSNKHGSVIWCCVKRGMQPQKPIADLLRKDGCWVQRLDDLEKNSYDEMILSNRGLVNKE
jgi:hypothetical protein